MPIIVKILWRVFNLAYALTGLFMAAFMAHVRRKQLKGADKLIEDDKRNYDNRLHGSAEWQPCHADTCVLFAQAGALNDHFQGLVLQWAKGLGGAVVVHSSLVKRRARAIEKLHRFYYGDSGWIIDLVEHHVCELQLGLAAIDAFKNDSGHDMYVTWRNMRAE
eukprot:gene8854-13367_t